MYCQKCGAAIQESARFCPSCGNQLNNAIIEAQTTQLISTPKPVLKKLSVEQEFHFIYISKALNLISYHTDMFSDGIELRIEQYNKFFRAMKYNQKKVTLKIDEIENIIMEEKRPAIYILWLLTSLVIFIASLVTLQLYGCVIALICLVLWFKTDKYLVIFSRQGILKIRDTGSVMGSDGKALVDFIRQRNPNCVKNIIMMD